MAGRTTKREVVQFVELVNQVKSEANMLIARAVTKENDRGEKITLTPHKSKMVDYTYFQVVEGKIDGDKRLYQALADIIHNGSYSVPSLVADINYGLEFRARADYAAGIDPAMTPVQRQAIENLRPLVSSGVLSMAVAVTALENLGLTPDQVETYLSSDE